MSNEEYEFEERIYEEDRRDDAREMFNKRIEEKLERVGAYSITNIINTI
jgi:hypothetical protein